MTARIQEPDTKLEERRSVVAGQDVLLQVPRDGDCAVDAETEASEFGEFGWVMDPEHNRVELWEPPPGLGCGLSRAAQFDMRNRPTPERQLPVLKTLLCSLLLWLAAATTAAFAKTPGEVEIGQPLRDATMLGLNGPARKLSEFRGKPLIINVWASWCAPCRQEMASLERLAWQDHAAKFTVIGISTDDYPERAQRLLKSSNATISHFIDSKLLLENMLGATKLPLTVLVDANGTVIDKIYGAKQWDGPDALALINKAFRVRTVARIQ